MTRRRLGPGRLTILLLAATAVSAAVFNGPVVEAASGAKRKATTTRAKKTTTRASTVRVNSTAKPSTTAPVTPSSASKTSIVMPSTADQYFVLYVKPDLKSTSAVEIPVAIVRGQAGSTTITDGRSKLPSGHYRVATLTVSKPGDVDADGRDDLAELADLGPANPLNPAPPMDIDTGAVFIPDHKTFEYLSYQGDEVARDAYLAGLEFVKFWIVDSESDKPAVYFMNTETHRAHPPFASVVGIPGGRGPSPGKLRGDIVYDAKAKAPDGSLGRYRFAFQPNDAYSFTQIALAYEALVTSMPTLAGKLMYYPFPQSALPLYEAEKSQYDAYRVPVLVE